MVLKKLAKYFKKKKSYLGFIPYTRINSRRNNDLNVNKNYRKHFK